MAYDLGNVNHILKQLSYTLPEVEGTEGTVASGVGSCVVYSKTQIS